MTLLWIAIFVVSFAVMIKGGDWFLEGAERIGLAIGLSPFIVGVLILGFGTSFPELISSGIAVMKGATDIPVGNAIGSNIANILLVVGLAAQFAKKKRLKVSKNLIDLDIPLLAAGTGLFLLMAIDGVITIPESAILILSYGIYFLYTVVHKDEELEVVGEEYLEEFQKQQALKKNHVGTKDLVKLIVGVVALTLGAKYLIDSVIELSSIFGVASGLIAVTAVAFGTSLPELLVSVRAAMADKAEVALGNIFGSNIFNLFMVVGLPGFFGELTIDPQTLEIGVPVLTIATLLFIISGISRKIYIWEGGLYLSIYLVFIGKLFNIF